uniref:Uncharacterized protein n=1 Tax=Cannabis sativa TaxID=3483 RepID=A0A803P9J5_CANSA
MLNHTPPTDPDHFKVVEELRPNDPVINKGLKVSGITYSAAKRHAREPINSQGKPRKPETIVGQTISFVNDEATYLLHPHHDVLVISFLNALRDMKVDESIITRKSTVLIGFSGEQNHSIGEVNLHVWAEGVNLQTKFIVVEFPSSYNAILGRPWIHEMKVVPSTYHQVIKFPTPWGIKQILGAQREARECYQSTLKEKQSTSEQLHQLNAMIDPDEPNMEELNKVSISKEFPEHKVQIRAKLTPEL